MKYIYFIFCIFLASIAYSGDSMNRVRVIKKEKKLILLAGKKIVGEYKVSLGKNPVGHKHKEGDKKTPEGVYVLDYKKIDSAFYKSIHISYPNENDKNFSKENSINLGGNIMIHGQRNGFGWLYFLTQKFDWTDGCIALKNKDMDEIWVFVKEGMKIEILP